jgi:outer membrane receptor for ferrienterochelin and colicins
VNTPVIDILVGGQYYADHGEVLFGQLPFMPDSTVSLFNDGATEVDFSNIITYAQATASFGGFNFTIGGRYEKHSEGFTSIVPRFAVTKAFNKIHFKVLASQSFRSPFIYNFMDTISIVPEKATIFEFETGYKFTDNLFLQLNAFHIQTLDMLYYFNDPLTGDGGYYNSEEKSGSLGFETELKYIQKKFSFNLGYSYYNAGSLNKIESFMINSSPSRYYLMDQDSLTDDPARAASYMLGFSPHKVTLNLNYEFCKYFQVNLNTMLLGKRYGYETALYDTIGNETLYIREYKPFALVNIYFNFTNIMDDDLSIGFGIFNILNSEYGYITPYLAYHGQIPAMGRELVFKVTYKVD